MSSSIIQLAEIAKAAEEHRQRCCLHRMHPRVHLDDAVEQIPLANESRTEYMNKSPAGQRLRKLRISRRDSYDETLINTASNSRCVFVVPYTVMIIRTVAQD